MGKGRELTNRFATDMSVGGGLCKIHDEVVSICLLFDLPPATENTQKWELCSTVCSLTISKPKIGEFNLCGIIHQLCEHTATKTCSIFWVPILREGKRHGRFLTGSQLGNMRFKLPAWQGENVPLPLDAVPRSQSLKTKVPLMAQDKRYPDPKKKISV